MLCSAPSIGVGGLIRHFMCPPLPTPLPTGIPSLYIPFGVEDVGGLIEKRGKEGSSEHESDDMGTPDPIHSHIHTHLPSPTKFKHTGIIQYMTRPRISTPQDVGVDRQGDGHYERPRVLRGSITYT